MILSEGDRVAADATLLSSHDILVDESLLTGESVPVEKHAEASSPVLAGTLVVRGEASARVTATGVHTEMGKIGASLKAIDLQPSRLQQETRRLVRVFGVFGIATAVAVVLLYGALRGSWLQAALSGIAVGMSMLPEEFPLVLTVFTVMGAWRIARARVLTRRSPAIEALGTATLLCTDKTGTLTENRMTVAALRTGDSVWFREESVVAAQPLRELLEVAARASMPNPVDPMETAIRDLHDRLAGGPSAALDLVKRLGLRPDLPAMTMAWRESGDTVLLCTKGAPETVAALCGLSPDQLRAVHAQVEILANKGMRVLGVAQGRVSSDTKIEDQAGLPLLFLGLVGLIDPVRQNVPAAVAECRSAGIRVMMITGDHPVTARAIAEQCGLPPSDIVTGVELDALSDDRLAECLQSANVFARIKPAQKLRIVEALKAGGDVVAMTGDGVNDAPALKAANIGVAMGGRGTDVAREAASIVLLDDDFASLVHTIRLGRRIFDNLKKAMLFIVAVHVAVAGLALFPLLLALPVLLWPVHIAFLEMLIDPACSLVFEAEGEEGGIMRRPPRPKTSSLLSLRSLARGFAEGLVVLAAAGAACAIALARGMPEDELRALVFVTLVASSLMLIAANRAFSASLIGALSTTNRVLMLLAGAVIAALGTILLLPQARHLFRFGALHIDDLSIAAAAGVVALLALQFVKAIWNRLPRHA
jgi:Ca2+-transporting ATPase